MAVMIQEQITLSGVTDVKMTCRYYILQKSTLDAPSKPTTYPPASPWIDNEPGYTAGSEGSLYFVDCTVFSDDTFEYSGVSLSSSYEAAKAAYNKAVSAEDTAGEANNKAIFAESVANEANEKITNLEIGARNLIRNSVNLIYADYSFGQVQKDTSTTAILAIGVLGRMVLGSSAGSSSSESSKTTALLNNAVLGKMILGME